MGELTQREAQPVVGNADVRRQGRLRRGVAEVVAKVGEPGRAWAHGGGNLQGFVQAHVRRVRPVAQGVHDEGLHAGDAFADFLKKENARVTEVLKSVGLVKS